jgi:hypothetical protein
MNQIYVILFRDVEITINNTSKNNKDVLNETDTPKNENSLTGFEYSRE